MLHWSRHETSALEHDNGPVVAGLAFDTCLLCGYLEPQIGLGQSLIRKLDANSNEVSLPCEDQMTTVLGAGMSRSFDWIVRRRLEHRVAVLHVKQVGNAEPTERPRRGRVVAKANPEEG